MGRMKRLKTELSEKGYSVEKEIYRHATGVMSKEFYTKNNNCIEFFKLGKSSPVIYIYSGWESCPRSYGDLIMTDASVEDVEDFVAAWEEGR